MSIVEEKYCVTNNIKHQLVIALWLALHRLYTRDTYIETGKSTRLDMKTHKTHQLDIKDVHVSLQAVGVTYPNVLKK